MISPHEIEAMSQNLIQIYSQIESDLIQNIASRFSVVDKITSDTVTDWQTEKLMQLGGLREENVRIIAGKSKKTKTEIKRILSEAGYKSIATDERIYQMAFSEGLLPYVPMPIQASPMIQQILEGAFQNTRTYMNLVNTTAMESANQAFLDIVNQTYLETSMGVYDYHSSIRKAVRQLADQGITGATYTTSSGRTIHNHMDVAIRRNIVTSTSQTTGKMQIQRAKEWGSNLVEVTSHMGARPSHAVWQGKIYSLKGGTRKYPNLVEATGYGSVSGLKGANCAHDFYPFFEGISEQTYRPFMLQENEKVYGESQVQRKFERDIRRQKRRILVAQEVGDQELLLKSQLKLKEKERGLEEHLEATGRTQRRGRQQVIRFGQSEAMKAVWANMKAQK